MLENNFTKRYTQGASVNLMHETILYYK